MSKRKLLIQAGPEAYHTIKTRGLSPDMISGVAAAAGGPKWFTTYGLVRYIISDFLATASQELHFIGASVGSWQMTAALTNDPGAAIDRLQRAYSKATYSLKPTEQEVSTACADMIRQMIGGDTEHVINHPNRRLHIISSRGKGLLSHSNKALRAMGFGYSFVTNMLGRERLRHTADRVVFSNVGGLPYGEKADILPTYRAALSPTNLLPALRASGTIPFMMEGIQDIEGGPTGYYWDGGMTDYHITLPYNINGLIIHPHFMSYVLQGWFDKKLPWDRRPTPELMSKVVLVSPSQDYIRSLPRQQISDMTDFKYYGEDQQGRVDYWTEISQRSLELGEALSDLITTGKIAEEVVEYSPLR